MTGHESAAALADSSMWEEVNGANPQMVVEGDLIWRGAGVCADPVALAQAAMEEITRLTRERDEARDRIAAAPQLLEALEEAEKDLVACSISIHRDLVHRGNTMWEGVPEILDARIQHIRTAIAAAKKENE